MTTTETRLVYTPHPVTCEGQANLSAELLPGEKLGEFLRRVAPDTRSGDWAASIGGRAVPTQLWDRITPKNGQLIEVRSVMRKQALYIVAMVALTYFTFGAGTIAGFSIGTSTALGTMVAQAFVFAAGSAIGGKVIR